jgi:hypothetical protein
MDNKKCDKDCETCNIHEKVYATLEAALKENRPICLIAEVSDEGATILLAGDQKEVVTLIINAMRNDERVEELFMRVMAIKSRLMLKDIVGSDILGEIDDKMKAHFKSKSSPPAKPKAEC